MSAGVRTRTLTLNFDWNEGGLPNPQDLRDFVVNELGLCRADLHCVQYDRAGDCIHLKVNSSEEGESPTPEVFEEVFKTAVWSMECAGGSERTVLITTNGRKTTRVTIVNLPPEVKDKDITKDLSRYGVVMTFEDLLYGADHPFAGIRSGNKIITMLLSEDIPSFIDIAGQPVFVEYKGQPRTCQVCSSKEHLRSKCPERKGRKRLEEREREQENEDPPTEADSDAHFSPPEPRRAVSEPPPHLPPEVDASLPAAQASTAADAPQHPSPPPADVTPPADAPLSDSSQPQQHPVSEQTTEGGGSTEEKSGEPKYAKSWEIVKETLRARSTSRKRQASGSPEQEEKKKEKKPSTKQRKKK